MVAAQWLNTDGMFQVRSLKMYRFYDPVLCVHGDSTILDCAEYKWLYDTSMLPLPF